MPALSGCPPLANKKCRSSGRKLGRRCVSSRPDARRVAGRATPPFADTRKTGWFVPAAKRISPLAFQLPPTVGVSEGTGTGKSHIANRDPPVKSVRRSLPLEKNAIAWLSGDQIGTPRRRQLSPKSGGRRGNRASAPRDSLPSWSLRRTRSAGRLVKRRSESRLRKKKLFDLVETTGTVRESCLSPASWSFVGSTANSHPASARTQRPQLSPRAPPWTTRDRALQTARLARWAE